MRTRSPEPGPVLTDRIIGLAIKVHRTLGPGLLESLCWELNHHGIPFEHEVPLPVLYEDMRIDKGFRADVIVNQILLLKPKSVERIQPVHEAQIQPICASVAVPSAC